MQHRVDLPGDVDVPRDVALDELERGVREQRPDVAEPSRQQIVEHDDLMALREEMLGQMAPEEAGAAGDDEPHQVFLTSTSGRPIPQ